VYKLLYFALLFFWTPIRAQENTVATITATAQWQIDTAAISLQTFPKNFKKSYTDKEFIYEFQAPEKNAWDRFKEWLADLLSNLFQFTGDANSMGIVNILLKAIAVLIVIGVVYLIVKAFLNRDGQWIFGKNSDRKVIHYDAVEQNLHTTDFAKLIKDALGSGEKRLSIRYYYLWYLKKLSHSNLIEWDIEKTNADFLQELANPLQKDRFAYLSYLYEYVWYGDFELDNATYSKTIAAFDDAIKSAGHE